MKKKEEKNGKNEKKNEFSTILGGVYVLGSFFLFSDDSVFARRFLLVASRHVACLTLLLSAC